MREERWMAMDLADTIGAQDEITVSDGEFFEKIKRGDLMPRFDGTGPTGMGPLTGRGMGFCVVPLSGTSSTGYVPSYRPAPVYRYGYSSMPRFFFGAGRGYRVLRGRGRGRGRRRW